MGQKTHPIGFRLGGIRDWDAKWFAAKSETYRETLLEDFAIRKHINKMYVDAGIAQVNIERGNNDLVVTLHTSRPGIVIGRGGTRIEELRKDVEKTTGNKSRVNVQEIRQPELNAYLVARNIADQIERRVAYRRAIRQALSRAMQAGAKGIKVLASGRLGGNEIARKEKAMEGRVPLHTLRADIDYGLAEAATSMGKIGVKVWLYKGDILPQQQEEVEELGTIEVTLQAGDTEIDEALVASPESTDQDESVVIKDGLSEDTEGGDVTA